MAWLALALSLGVWWWILGFRQAKTISEISVSAESQTELHRVNRMLQLEGSFFLIILTLGGITLTILSYRDEKRSKLISDFFSTVTHEMRTPIASLQLQIEVMMESTKDPDLTKKLNKLWKENQRIESQMGNAFYLASLMQGESLYLETTSILELKENFFHSESQVEWEVLLDPNFTFKIDRKALESIFKNLVDNARRHGKAKSIKIKVQKDESLIQFFVEDNGSGFQGDHKYLTKPFVRLTATSGSGIGLYIVKKLAKKMNGKLKFPKPNEGFVVQLEFKLE
ncbi:HAMP domain-containing sensor histidine kinase [Leptospira sp. 96542]|nr:HAMP domain-containing sensor histidine kinase [Leptospira sp. 96542]